MRVLMVLSSLEVGGAEKTALELVRSAPAGWEVIVASIKDGPLRTDFAAAAAALHAPIAHFKYDPLGLWQMRKIVRRERIDAMIVVDAPRDGMFYGFLGSALAGRPVVRVCWCKSIPGGQAPPFATALARYLRRHQVDAVVATSRRQRQALVGCGLDRRKIPLIRNGVDLSAWARGNGPAEPKRLIVQVANVMPDKDPQTLLRAAGLLARRRGGFEVLLAGRGTNSPEMARAAADAGAEQVVTLAGHCSHVPELLARADVFVLSTRSEVFSVAVLEALAAGAAVVVSDIPAFDEMLTAGRDALKVPPGDAEALAEAIERLLDDEPLRQSLSSAGERRAKVFSRQRMSDNFGRLIAAMARDKGIQVTRS